MAKKTEPAGKKTLKENISLLLQKHRIILLGVLGALVAVLIIMSVVVAAANKRLEKGILRVEALQESYETEWIAAEDDEAKSAAAEKINIEIEQIIEKYRKGFPGQKALLIKGDMAYREERWNDAAADYAELADTFPESYLAPVALMHAASAAEEGEDLEASLGYFQRLVDQYPENLEEVYRAMFNIGRIHELLGNRDQALESYNSLLDKGQDNSWNSLAQSRVIVLEAE